MYEIAQCNVGLPTPLDEQYNLVNECIFHTSSFGGLGYHNSYSELKNFEGKDFYHYDVMEWKNVKSRPFGIREHSSMRTEYYYDVMELYDYIVGKLTE